MKELQQLSLESEIRKELKLQAIERKVSISKYVELLVLEQQCQQQKEVENGRRKHS